VYITVYDGDGRCGMIIQRAVLVFALTSMSGFALAQQTGTVIGRTPGSAAGARISSTKVTPKATCESPVPNGAEMPAVPEMLFSRKMGRACLRSPSRWADRRAAGWPCVASGVQKRKRSGLFCSGENTNYMSSRSRTTLTRLPWPFRRRRRCQRCSGP